jgi:hypothetical protein
MARRLVAIVTCPSFVVSKRETEAQALAWAPDSMRYSRFPPRNYRLALHHSRTLEGSQPGSSPGHCNRVEKQSSQTPIRRPADPFPPLAASLRRSALGANAARAGTNHFRAAAVRTTDAHIHVSQSLTNPLCVSL